MKPYDTMNPIETKHENHNYDIMDGLPNISGFNYRIARHKVGDDAEMPLAEHRSGLKTVSR
jgi:hypothetical protein